MSKLPFAASITMILYYPVKVIVDIQQPGDLLLYIVTSVVFIGLTAIIYWEISRYLKLVNSDVLAKLVQAYIIALIVITVSKLTNQLINQDKDIGILTVLYFLPGLLGLIVSISFLFLDSNTHPNTFFLKQFSLLSIIVSVIVSYADYANFTMHTSTQSGYISAIKGIPFIALAVFLRKREKALLSNSTLQ